MSLPKAAGDSDSTVPPKSINPRLELGIGQGGVDLLVELVDNLDRSVLGCAHASIDRNVMQVVSDTGRIVEPEALLANLRLGMRA